MSHKNSLAVSRHPRLGSVNGHESGFTLHVTVDRSEAQKLCDFNLCPSSAEFGWAYERNITQYNDIQFHPNKNIHRKNFVTPYWCRSYDTYRMFWLKKPWIRRWFPACGKYRRKRCKALGMYLAKPSGKPWSSWPIHGPFMAHSWHSKKL